MRRGSTRRGWRFGWMLIAALAVTLGFPGCGGGSGGGGDDGGGTLPPPDEPDPGELTGVASTPSADLQAMAARIHAVLAIGYNTSNADAVAKLLLDGNPANDPFVVDTREAEDFANGHIPGSVNIPLQDLPRRLREGTAGIPSDRDVVVSSYWGGDGAMANLLINLVRITDPTTPTAFKKSTTIFQGMVAWTFRRDMVPANTRFQDAQAAGIVVQQPTETVPHPGVDQAKYATFAPFPEDDVLEKILYRAEEYLDSVPTQFDLHVYPNALVPIVAAGGAQILSVRSAADYAKGHVPGAINIPWQKVADLANQTKFLDPTRTIYAYCYTSHTCGQATMALGILGYPVRSLLYGMNGWTQSTAVASGQLANFDLMRAWDFPLDDGGADDLGSLSAFVPASGCQGCHTDLTSIFYDREIANVPPAPPVAPSEGEG